MYYRAKKIARTFAVAAYIVVIESYMLLKKGLFRLKTKPLSVQDGEAARRLREDGYVIIEDYLDEDEVTAIICAVDQSMIGQDGDWDHINRVSYYRRPSADAQWDGGVYRLYGAHEIDERLRSFRHDMKLKSIIEVAFSTRVSCAVTLVQENLPRGAETRGFHIDMYAPLECKAFLFLTDVDCDAHGPYAIVEGSHRRFWWRLGNYLSRGLRDAEPVTTVERVSETDLEQVAKFMVKKGSVVLSCQQAVHRGLPHSEGRRVAVVNYYPARTTAGTPEFDDDNRLGYRY